MADQKLLSVPHTLAEQKCLLKINTSTHLKVCYLFSLNNYRHTQQSTSAIQTRMVTDVIVSVCFFSPFCCAFVKWMSEIYSMEMNGVSLGGIKRNEV